MKRLKLESAAGLLLFYAAPSLATITSFFFLFALDQIFSELEFVYGWIAVVIGMFDIFLVAIFSVLGFKIWRRYSEKPLSIGRVYSLFTIGIGALAALFDITAIFATPFVLLTLGMSSQTGGDSGSLAALIIVLIEGLILSLGHALAIVIFLRRYWHLLRG